MPTAKERAAYARAARALPAGQRKQMRASINSGAKSQKAAIRKTIAAAKKELAAVERTQKASLRLLSPTKRRSTKRTYGVRGGLIEPAAPPRKRASRARNTSFGVPRAPRRRATAAGRRRSAAAFAGFPG